MAPDISRAWYILKRAPVVKDQYAVKYEIEKKTGFNKRKNSSADSAYWITI